MVQLMSKIPGVAVFLDDILVTGSTEQEHDERLLRVLNILQENNVKVNKSKSVLKAYSIEYLGYDVSGKGIKPSECKIKAIAQAPAPTSVAEVKSFVGLVTYYCRFVPHFATILAPLYDLLQKNAVFKWTNVEENAFLTIKEELCNSAVLSNFDGCSPLILEVDASPVGVGCVLKQVVNNGEQTVYFASKKLSPAEKNYSQLDREALAVVYGVVKLKYFLLGREFVVKTDHKPLLGLFGKQKQIPIHANARLQRWALLLSQFNFDLVFRSGKENYVADALSRLPIVDPDNDSGVPVEYVNLIKVIEYSDIDLDKVKRYTRQDPILKHVVNNLKFGWQNQPNVSEYSKIKNDLSLHDEIVLFRNRVVIPSELRKVVLDHLHFGHNGVNAMKVEARRWVWWPKLDQDLLEVTKSCSICFCNHQQPQSQSLAWPDSGKPWSRLHIDYAGPINGQYFLVIVDSYSKFMDVHVTDTISSKATIKLLRRTFANFGLPDRIVSDNAACFCSAEMDEFLSKNGVTHVTPAPYNPSSNGLAERAVRTFKSGLRKFDIGDIHLRLCRFLYNQRSTVSASTGKTPSEMLMGRTFKGPLHSFQKEKKKKGKIEEEVVCVSKYKLNDAVFVRNYGKGEKWLPGRVIEELGVRNYKIQLADQGNVFWRRHADQIMPRYVTTVAQNVNKPITPLVLNNSSVDKSCNFEAHDRPSCDFPNSDVDFPDSLAQENVQSNTSSIKSPIRAPEIRTKSGRLIKPPDRLNL